MRRRGNFGGMREPLWPMPAAGQGAGYEDGLAGLSWAGAGRARASLITHHTLRAVSAKAGHDSMQAGAVGTAEQQMAEDSAARRHRSSALACSDELAAVNKARPGAPIRAVRQRSAATARRLDATSCYLRSQ